MKAWKAAGVTLPHSAGQQYRIGKKISKSNLRNGDWSSSIAVSRTWGSTRQRQGHPRSAPGQTGVLYQDEPHAVYGCTPARLTVYGSTDRKWSQGTTESARSMSPVATCCEDGRCILAYAKLGNLISIGSIS